MDVILNEITKYFSVLHRGLFIFILAFGSLMLIQEIYLYRKTKLSYHRTYSIFFALMSISGFVMVIGSYFIKAGLSVTSCSHLIFQGILFFIAIIYFKKALSEKKTAQKRQSAPK